MTQTERNRFTVLSIILIVLVIAGVAVAQFRRRSEVGADILGVIQNQAVATFTDPDGVSMEPTLSDISQLTVSGGVGTISARYSLAKRTNQTIVVDVQFWRPGENQPYTVIIEQNGEEGSLTSTLKNIPNGTYDISIKPRGYLSQTIKNFSYQNGKPNNLDFKDPFLWGDVDVSNGGFGDNKVNSADFSVVAGAWDTDNAKADFNADGVVNNADASVLLTNWDKTGTQFNTKLLIEEDETEVPAL